VGLQFPAHTTQKHHSGCQQLRTAAGCIRSLLVNTTPLPAPTALLMTHRREVRAYINVEGHCRSSHSLSWLPLSPDTACMPSPCRYSVCSLLSAVGFAPAGALTTRSK
jgi:hypothetical protein